MTESVVAVSHEFITADESVQYEAARARAIALRNNILAVFKYPNFNRYFVKSERSVDGFSACSTFVSDSADNSGSSC
jgi:hypothetical protein